MAVAPFVPFVGLYGYLNGFEVHQDLFCICSNDGIVSSLMRRSTNL